MERSDSQQALDTLTVLIEHQLTACLAEGIQPDEIQQLLMEQIDTYHNQWNAQHADD